MRLQVRGIPHRRFGVAAILEPIAIFDGACITELASESYRWSTGTSSGIKGAAPLHKC